MNGASSARSPASRLITPGGKSLVAIISENVSAGSGLVEETSTTAQLPLKITGITSETNASSGGSSGQMTTRDRVHRAENLTELVGPTGVMHESIDRERRFRRSRRPAATVRTRNLV